MTKFENLTEVSNLSECKINLNYYTTNYSLFKTRGDNRSGLDNNRVKNFVKEINNGTYDYDLSNICIQMNGEVTEGTHRVQAHIKTKTPICFKVVRDKTVVEIAHFNSGMNSKWKPEEHFDSAHTSGSKAVIEIKPFRESMLKKYGIARNKLSAPELYGLLVGNPKHFSSGKQSPTVGMWLSDDLLPLTKKREFKKLVAVYCEMKQRLINVRDSYKVCKSVMELHFDEKEEFDVYTFVKGMALKGFPLDNYKIPTIKSEAVKLYNKVA